VLAFLVSLIYLRTPNFSVMELIWLLFFAHFLYSQCQQGDTKRN
jgi:hypothetical protein